MRSLTSAAPLALLLAVGSMAAVVPTASQAYIGVGISVNLAPPPLPYYEQPAIPGYGYLWTPGYWAWDPGVEDYYWVPGAWVLPPRVGYLWTPSYWGWRDGLYVFNNGYWGPHIGFYGGINYGFGYNGYGFFGGEWRGNNFFYNRSVNNVRNINVTNVYTRNVTNYTTVNRVSYAGGAGGVQARPTPEQVAASREQHVGFTPMQQQHVQAARMQPSQRASVNHGAPPIAATARPASFSGPGVVAARGAGPVRPAPAGSGFRPGAPNNAPHSGPRPGAGQDRPYQGRPQGGEAPNFRPAAPNRPTPYRPAAQMDRPAFSQPRPQPQFARPAPSAPRPEAQFARPAPQSRPAPQPQARPAPQPRHEPHPAAREDHPHEEHH